MLAAAGHRVAKRPRQLPAGLTDRELEVLLALAAGQTNKEIAETLGISTKTAGHHVQHILDKTGAQPGPPRPSGRSTPPRTVRLTNQLAPLLMTWRRGRAETTVASFCFATAIATSSSHAETPPLAT